jgi:predicted secreted Zn-dependent protease
MSSVEPARHALYSELERVLGSEHAKTLMSYLPPHTSDEAVTKVDVARLEARMEERFARMEERFDRMEERFNRMDARLEDRFERLAERMDRMQRFYVGTTVGSMTALTAIFTLAVSFLN